MKGGGDVNRGERKITMRIYKRSWKFCLKFGDIFFSIVTQCRRGAHHSGGRGRGRGPDSRST